ncbi:hypothetical protein CspHIS471_0107990 [Cutaneotrichosporon sp. HIS471]|nr:hypothetical protein CspHIS471_0107990 [Cutaneotrichosporon sp. HIS471]
MPPMPKIIYGTAWKKDHTAELVYTALKSGFRGIDTACQPKSKCRSQFIEFGSGPDRHSSPPFSAADPWGDIGGVSRPREGRGGRTGIGMSVPPPKSACICPGQDT